MNKTQALKYNIHDNTTWKFDRFIPQRNEINENSCYNSVVESTPSKYFDIIKQNPYDWPVQHYKNSLKKIFESSKSKSDRVLPFVTNVRNKKEIIDNGHWPVKPRQKPIIGSAWAILDLPNFINAFDRNLLDWGKCNYVAAALWDSVYIWHAVSSKTLMIPYQRSTAIKWSCDGSSLFTASKESIKVWDAESLKVKATSNHLHCVEFHCSITAVDWCPYGNIVVAGCDHGGVAILYSNGRCQIISKGRASHTIFSIISISFSYNSRYIAASRYDSFVNIWTFPDGLPYFKIKMCSPTRGLAWHPTKHSYLCLGDTSGLLALWNISSRKNIKVHRPDSLVAVYSLSFSEISGELVTSHLQIDTVNPISQVNVLASFDKVVDRIENEHEGRILYLKWSPDGTQLATAGADETLQIWNFTNLKKDYTEKYLKSKTKYITSKLNCSIR